MATIAVLGTLDTKGEEHGYVADLIRSRGHEVLLIDTGTLEPPTIQPDVSRQELADAAGADSSALATRRDRGESVKAMAEGAAIVVAKLVAERKIQGIVSLGGGGGTAIGTAAMRALPVGFPKLMVSTLAASENVSEYIGVKDIVMMPSIVDVAGLNRVSRQIFTNAAGAICGMVETEAPDFDDKPIIVASMFGNTTDCVDQAKAILEGAGYEVLVFHATGTGGRAMEGLIEAGLVSGVLDLTTTEWADEHVGGILAAGPTRLEAAARKGVPAVIGPGCLDMVNFGPRDTIPEKFDDRLFYEHNPQITLMRTTSEECAELGRILAEKINLSTGLVSVLLPTEAISVISAPDQPFHDPAADQTLFAAIKDNLRADVEALEIPASINDLAFSEAAAKALLKMMREHLEQD
ncbi:MAG: Tm-1-like ATP-binding domain-containing protein [Opitutales bacterium]